MMNIYIMALNAAAIGDITTLKKIKDDGFNLLDTYENGHCLLYNAIITSQHHVVEYLFSIGEDPNRIITIQSRVDPSYKSCCLPIYLVKDIAMYELLKENGANINMIIDGRFLLYFLFLGEKKLLIQQAYKDNVRINAKQYKIIENMLKLRHQDDSHVLHKRIEKLKLFIEQ